MTVILDLWNRQWQSVRFDTVAGTGRVRWFSCRTTHPAGWAYFSKGVWYALYLDDSRIVFSAGRNHRFRSQSCAAINVRHGSTRTLKILLAQVEAFRVVYDVAAEFDGSDSDVLDLEAHDFFFWTARVLTDEKLQRSLKNAWSVDKKPD